MDFRRYVTLALAVLALGGCRTETVEREVGYRGEARLNPWLAAERFSQREGHTALSLGGWERPEDDDAVWFVPGTMLNNQSYLREIKKWVEWGGHLVILLEYADVAWHDWSASPSRAPVSPALETFLDETGMQLEKRPQQEEDSTANIELAGRRYRVSAEPAVQVKANASPPGAFASAPYGLGRVSVLADARMLRNRWIGEREHAAFLRGLLDVGRQKGRVVFLRGSDISFWELLVRDLRPVLLGAAVCAALWLWKNFSRFGPLEAAASPSPLRAYDHHLEALGEYQWRIDRAAALLEPLRARVAERAQQVCARVGKVEDELWQAMAERADLPPPRVLQAMTGKPPADAAALTRATMDLQRLLRTFS